ncbi:hypothetical protein VTK26DRAFT_8665 [Humicola hyalothermophila]
MRAEPASLVGDQTELPARAPVTHAEDGQPRLRTHPGNAHRSTQPGIFGLLTSARTAMTSARPDGSESNTTVEVAYASAPRDPKEGGNAANSDGAQAAKPVSKMAWAWCGSLLVRFWLVVSASYAFLVVIEPVVQHVFGQSTQKDPFANWGKPGTGTEDLAWYPTDFLRDVLPIPCHSHNDYWRKVPLFCALYAGCTGVEADVWLQDGDLLVGHEKSALQPNRTFRSLYVSPLVDILTRQNPTTDYYDGTNHGVFDVDPEQTLVLLVDLKTNGRETWPLVMEQLTPLREKGWLSFYEKGQFHSRPITVVGTGNTPFDLIVRNATYRDAFFDAPLDQLKDSTFDATNSYYASTSFWKSIGAVWWKGSPSDRQLEKIREHLAEAHSRGLKARYWNLPAWPIHVRNRLWGLLVEEGIDMLNVDDLQAAARTDWTKPVIFL